MYRDVGSEKISVGGRDLAISGDRGDNWYVGWSPGQEMHSAEGSWEQWVRLAREILKENGLRKFTDWQKQPLQD
jgi:hypothetical protein